MLKQLILNLSTVSSCRPRLLEPGNIFSFFVFLCLIFNILVYFFFLGKKNIFMVKKKVRKINATFSLFRVSKRTPTTTFKAFVHAKKWKQNWKSRTKVEHGVVSKTRSIITLKCIYKCIRHVVGRKHSLTLTHTIIEIHTYLYTLGWHLFCQFLDFRCSQGYNLLSEIRAKAVNVKR